MTPSDIEIRIKKIAEIFEKEISLTIKCDACKAMLHLDEILKEKK